VHPGGKKCVDLIGVVHRSQWSYNFPAAKREKNNDAGEILKNNGDGVGVHIFSGY